MSNTEKYIADLFSEVEKNANLSEHFICVYGSAATKSTSTKSDLDFFIAAPEVKAVDREKISKFAEDFHRRRGIKVDEEVPYMNKVIVSYSDLDQAVHLKGFNRLDGRVVVPPIVKDPVFLASKEVRFRLLLNALTVPHIINQETTRYLSSLKEAQHSIFLLAVDLAEKRSLDIFDTDCLLKALLESKNGQNGEMFLGYKQNAKVIDHLHGILKVELTQSLSVCSNLLHYVLEDLKRL